MRVLNLFFAALIAGGCAIYSGNSYSNDCNYEKIASPELKIEKYGGLYFEKFSFDGKDIPISEVKKIDDKLKSSTLFFKVIEKDVFYTAKNEYASNSSMEAATLYDGRYYKKSGQHTTKVLSSDCTYYSLKPSDRFYMAISSFSFSKINEGKKPTLRDIWGDKSVYLLKFETTSEYDEFKNEYLIETNLINFDDKAFELNLMNFGGSEFMFLRTVITKGSKSPVKIQIYRRFITTLGWSSFRYAIDKNSNRYSVLQIDQDVHSCGYSEICMYDESIAVEVDSEIILNQKVDFEVKLYGKSNEVIKVPIEMIASMKEALEIVRK